MSIDEQLCLNTYPMLRYFAFEHLPEHLAAISKPFHDIAWNRAHKGIYMEEAGKRETAIGLRKLLESKDAFVRSGV